MIEWTWCDDEVCDSYLMRCLNAIDRNAEYSASYDFWLESVLHENFRALVFTLGALCVVIGALRVYAARRRRQRIICVAGFRI